MTHEASCLFCKIVAGSVPSQKVYEDDEVLAFNDIHPVAPVHILIIPKMHVASLADCGHAEEKILSKMLLLAPKLAQEKGLKDGFRTMINTGTGGGQEIFHLHYHIFGGDPSMLQAKQR